ncbi:uncharacterized protein LOC132704687 [Cylas formicarius]|uniref:uncharacterized protein LOC132704687 n=1 Tax=Cylas formicarius TaxID=197179 RepID=UPI002958C312|nr:uncharacterized protein LOC132704687 [Cylas formicarius]
MSYSDTLDRIQREIKESVQREKELRNGYASKVTKEICGDIYKNFNKNSSQESKPDVDPSKTNGFRKFIPNSSTHCQKGVMHKFIKCRGKLSMLAIKNNDHNEWCSDAAFKPAKIVVGKGGKPLRNGFISAEEKMRKELEEFQTREAELRKERRKSQPNLMAALLLENHEFTDGGFHSNLLKPAKSMANLYCNNSDDGYEESTSGSGSLKPARSLAELCDVSDDEAGLPGTHSLIMQFENMKQRAKNSGPRTN